MSIGVQTELEFFPVVKLNGRVYRRTKKAEISFGGKWEVQYKGKWHSVINYGIKTELNNLVTTLAQV